MSRLWIGAAILLALLLVAGPGSSMLLRGEIRAIRLYQDGPSRLVGSFVTCRFRPTCSHFAVEALESRGLWMGNALIACRLLHCSPLGVLWDHLASPEA